MRFPRWSISWTRMSRMPDKKTFYVFDTVVMSNFTLAGGLDLLISRYGKRLKITREVLDEITDGVVAGYTELQLIEDAVLNGVFGTAKQYTSPGERNTYRALLRNLGSGEASCIAFAETNGGIVVTDDKTARDCCIERGVKYTGTIGILKACLADGAVSEDDANEILNKMIKAGYYSPIRRISDA